MQPTIDLSIEQQLSALEHEYATAFEYEAGFEKLQLIWQQIKELRRTMACKIILGSEDFLYAAAEE